MRELSSAINSCKCHKNKIYKPEEKKKKNHRFLAPWLKLKWCEGDAERVKADS